MEAVADQDVVTTSVATTDNKSQKQAHLFPAEFEPNTSSSVQANILLRLAIFTPVRRGGKGLANLPTSHTADLTKEFRTLQLTRKEGYERVTITGSFLNFDTDFKVWCGIVWAISSMRKDTDSVELKFSAFAKYCGFSTRRIDTSLRERIEESLTRIRTQTIRFSKSSKQSDTGKGYVGGLIHSAEFDVGRDYIILTPDKKLWDLYLVDHQVLLKLKALKLLSRKEAAQCLYVFLSALPENPHPISFERIRDRMQLTSSVAEQNRTITAAIKTVIKIGYLDGEIIRKDGQRYLMVFNRDPKLVPLKM
jgi:hypothetical protein